MKVVDFLKRFKELSYDDETELDVLMLTSDYSIKLVKVIDIARNADCMGLNRVGIVVSESE